MIKDETHLFPEVMSMISTTSTTTSSDSSYHRIIVKNHMDSFRNDCPLSWKRCTSTTMLSPTAKGGPICKQEMTIQIQACLLLVGTYTLICHSFDTTFITFCQ
jgi:hypothetical protein